MKNKAMEILEQIIKDYKEFVETGDGDLFDERLGASIDGAVEFIANVEHEHDGDCKYLGFGLWDCGVTDQH